MSTFPLEFLAGLAHELRTPLGGIGGYAELLELGVKGPVTDAQRDALQRIRRNQQVMVALINNFMSYADIAASPRSVDLAPGAIGEVIDAVLVTGHAYCDRRRANAARGGEQTPGIQLSHDVNVEADTMIVTDKFVLSETLALMLLDGVESSAEGETVHMSVSLHDSRFCAEVRSVGDPFPIDAGQSVFTPFSPAGRGRRASASLHALALPHAHLLASALDGELTAAGEGDSRILRLSIPAALHSA